MQLFLYLQIELDENLAIADYKGTEHGHLKVKPYSSSTVFALQWTNWSFQIRRKDTLTVFYNVYY